MSCGQSTLASRPPVFGIQRNDAVTFLNDQRPGSIDLIFGSPPYEDARSYGIDFRLKGQAWVDWMVEVVRAALRACRGLVAFVVEGRTRKYQWSATPALLMADLHRAGIVLRKPPIYRRVGIPGSGGPDWLRNDYEWVVCATNGGRLPWADALACGQPPKYAAGGNMTYRRADGRRTNKPTAVPDVANPGNVVDVKAGGGRMGSRLCHETEAPFPERLAEFFVKSFCPPGGVVCDPFSGSGTTAAVALRNGRGFVGCDVRESQVELTLRRVDELTQ